MGAVLVDGNRIISTGYNGSPRGMAHCTTVGCLLDPLGHCRRTVHAEANAIVRSGLTNITGMHLTMYTTHRPCVDCVKLCVALGVKDVIYWIYRDDTEVDKFLEIAVARDPDRTYCTYYELLTGKLTRKVINVRKATTKRPTQK